MIFPDFLPECLLEPSLISAGGDFVLEFFILFLEVLDLLLENLHFGLCPAVLEILEYLVHIEPII